MSRPAAVELHLCIASRVAEVEPLCLKIRHWLRERGIRATFSTEILARESLLNGVIHGNRFCADNTVELWLQLRPRWIVLRVTDRGPGFAWHEQHDLPDIRSVHGRGVAIYRRYARRVRFNLSGNQVTFWIRRIQQLEEIDGDIQGRDSRQQTRGSACG